MLYFIILLTVALCAFAQKLSSDLTDEFTNYMEAALAYSVRANTYSTESIFVYGFLCGLVPIKIFNPNHAFRGMRKTAYRIRMGNYKLKLMPTLVKVLVRELVAIMQRRVARLSTTFKAYGLESFSLKDMIIDKMWKSQKGIFGDRNDRHILASWLVHQRRALAVVAIMLIGLLSTNVDPAISFSGVALGVVTHNNIKEEKTMVPTIKSWIDIQEVGKDTYHGEEISIALSWRYYLYIDLGNKKMAVVDIVTSGRRPIDMNGQWTRINTILTEIAEARKSAAAVPARTTVLLDRTSSEPGDDPITSIGEAMFGMKWPVTGGFNISADAAMSPLYEALNERKGRIMKAAKSISNWVHKEVEIDTFRIIMEDAKERAYAGMDHEKYELVHDEPVTTTMRRMCALVMTTGIDYKFVKIMDNTRVKRAYDKDMKRTIAKNSAKWEQETGTKPDPVAMRRLLPSESDWMKVERDLGGHGFTMSNDEILQEFLEDNLLPLYTDAGYTLIGGNPDSGTLLFVKAPTALTVKAAQKVAKVMLRGGIQLSNALVKTIEVTAIDFPSDYLNSSDKGGCRDGAMLLVRDRIMKDWCNAHGLSYGASAQGHIYWLNKIADRGVILTEAVSSEIRYLLGRHDAVMDAKAIKAVYGMDVKAGDSFKMPVDSIWFMEIDGFAKKTNAKAGPTIIDTAPKAMAGYFVSMVKESVQNVVDAAKSGDSRDLLKYLSDYGFMGPLKDSNLPIPLTPVYKKGTDGKPLTGAKNISGYKVNPLIQKTLVQAIIKANEKGMPIPRDCYRPRIVHDNSLSIKDSHGRPGLSVPIEAGLSIGDLVIILTYPSIKVDENKCDTLFVGVVEKLHNGDRLGIHAYSAKFALIDEDGDKHIMVIPTAKDWENFPGLAECGMAFVDIEGSVKDLDNTSSKAGVLQKVMKHESPIEMSRDVLAGYLQSSGNVGLYTNMVTSVLLYSKGKDLGSPTEEPMLVFLGKFKQGPIYNKKWAVSPAYSLEAFNTYFQVVLPQAYSNKRFTHHPEIACRKLSEEGERITGMDGTLAHINKAIKVLDDSQHEGSPWMDVIRIGTSLKVTKEGFVTDKFYKKISRDIYRELFTSRKSLIPLKSRRSELRKVVDFIISQDNGIISCAGNPDRWTESSEFLMKEKIRIKHSYKLAERLLIDTLLLYANTRVWTQTCDPEFLSAVGKYADDHLKETVMTGVGATYRNTLSAEEDYTGYKYKLRSGTVATRIWAEGADIPTVKDGDIFVINDYKASFKGIDINIDPLKSFCPDGRYAVVDIQDYTNELTGMVSARSKKIWFSEVNG